MEILKHRVNSIRDFDERFGIEIDVKDFKNRLVLAHDHPYETSEELEEFLTHVPNESLIAINVKSSEIEKDLKDIITKCKISNYFTFDHSIPSLLKALDYGLSCAFRLSEYEKEIISKCSWVWIDSFYKIWYDASYLKSLKKMGLKIALVSPELHNRESDLEKLKNIINSVTIDAICTDRLEYWQQ